MGRENKIDVIIVPFNASGIIRVPFRLLVGLVVSWVILICALFVLGIAEAKRQRELAKIERETVLLRKELEYIQGQRKALVVWLYSALTGRGISNEAWDILDKGMRDTLRVRIP